MTASGRADDEGPEGAPARLRSGRRSGVLPVALAVSAVLHAVAILLYPALMGRLDPGTMAVDVQGAASEFEATRVVRLAEVPETAPEEPVVEEEEEELEPEALQPEVPSTFPEEGVPAETADPDGLTAAERLRPREGDQRIWAPLASELAELTDEERAELRLQGKLDAWNDSVAAASARAAAARDWTVTDEDGDRWGVSPGMIHLGKFSLPLPFAFGRGGAGNRVETERRQWQWQDLERGAATQAARETLKERAQEIRRRRDEERREAADTTGGGGRTRR